MKITTRMRPPISPVPVRALILFLALGFVHAENQTIALQFSAFAVAGPPSVEIFVQNGEEASRVGFERRSRSGLIEYEGENPVTFFQKVEREDGTIQSVPVGRVTIPPELDRALLLFLPNYRRGEAPAYRIIAVNDDVDNFPAGSLRIFNGMGETVYGMIGGSVSVLEPGFSEPHSLLDFHGQVRVRTIRLADGSTREEKDINSTAEVRLARRRDGRYEPVYDSPLRVHPRTRYILLVFPAPDDPRGNRLFTQMLYEFLPPSPQPPQP